MPSAVNHAAALPSLCSVHPSPGCGAGADAVLAAPALGSVLAVGPGGCRGTRAVCSPTSVHGRSCFHKPSPDPALPHPGMCSRDSRCFEPSLGVLGWGVPAVLTGPVLVPGVAADGLQQEAVVGHGFQAGDRTRPPQLSRGSALATGTSPQWEPPLPAPPSALAHHDQPHAAAHRVPPSAWEGVSPGISKVRVCSSEGFSSEVGTKESLGGAGGDVPQAAAPWLGTPH